MSIIGVEDRTRVTNVSAGNFDLVVAIDTPTSGGVIPGSGFLISPIHVLTARHVTAGNPAARVTDSVNVSSLPSRANPASSIPNQSLNTSNILEMTSQDMSVLTLQNSLTTAAK